MPRSEGTRNDRQEIESVVRQLESAVNRKDLEGALSCYSFPDSASAARMRQQTEGGMALDTLSCSLRLGGVWGRGEEATAAVLQELDYRYHGRPQIIAGWRSFALRRSDGVWKIRSEEDRDCAQALYTDLEVDLDPDAGTMQGTADLRLSILLPGAETLILALNRGLSVTSVSDGSGRALTFRRKADALLLALPPSLRAGDTLTVKLEYGGVLFNESQERGYSQVSIAPEGSFASWVTAWYPQVQGAGSKSKGRITFLVPAGVTVACSGRPVERTIETGRERQIFAVDAPLEYSFAAARYFRREQVVDGVTVGVYFLQGGDAKADLYLATCARILSYLRPLYGMYPFDAYALVEIPPEKAGILGGSSEQGMNLFPVGMLPDSVISLPLLAHEIGHSWWGNLIRSEEGAVIDEGLSQMTAVLCVREFEGEQGMRRFLKYGHAAYPQSASMYFLGFAGMEGRDLPMGGRRYQAADGAILHDLADVKGHFVYNMLREEIGHAAFIDGLRSIVSQGAGRRRNLQDLQLAWERASGLELRTFFEEWFYRGGAPEFTLSDTVVAAGDGFHVSGEIRQVRETYHATVEIVAVLEDGVQREKVPASGPATPFSFTVPSRPRAVLLDPDYRVLRWTDEFKGRKLLMDAQALRAAGNVEEALAKLTEYLRAAPESGPGRYEAGLCRQDLGQWEQAAQSFRTASEGYRIYPAYEPILPLCLLHLGQISDLQGRRDEALEYYRQVLSLPDESGSQIEARRLMEKPYVAEPREDAPDEAALRGFEGAYSGEAFPGVKVSLAGDGALHVSVPGQPEFPLAWQRGALFGFHGGGMEIEVEFVKDGGGAVSGLAFRVAGREFQLKRTD